MAEFPALPIWTDALLGDTYHLSAAEFGAYMRLLICAWRTPECAIPNDDKKLGRMIGDPRVWKRIRTTVLAFWDLGDDGLWRQKRLTRERAFVTNRRQQSVTAAEARWLKNKKGDDAPASSPHMHPHPHPHPQPQPINNKQQKDGASAPSTVVDLEAKRPAREYAFYGDVVRLKPKDYDRWKERFHAIPDFDAMLGQIDEHYAANPGKRKSWFHAASGWLQNEHQKRMEAKGRADIARQKQAEQQAREQRWEAMERQGGEAAKQAREEHEQWQRDRMAFLRKRKAEKEARHDA